MTGWTARALSRMTGAPIQTITSWIAAGLVTTEQMGRGRGGHTIGVTGLMELIAVMELRQAGFSLQSIRRGVENLRTLSGHDRPLARLTLVISGQDIVWQDQEHVSESLVSALQKPGQRLMVLPIGDMQVNLLQELNVPSEVSQETLDPEKQASRI